MVEKSGNAATVFFHSLECKACHLPPPLFLPLYLQMCKKTVEKNTFVPIGCGAEKYKNEL